MAACRCLAFTSQQLASVTNDTVAPLTH